MPSDWLRISQQRRVIYLELSVPCNGEAWDVPLSIRAKKTENASMLLMVAESAVIHWWFASFLSSTSSVRAYRCNRRWGTKISLILTKESRIDEIRVITGELKWENEENFNWRELRHRTRSKSGQNLRGRSSCVYFAVASVIVVFRRYDGERLEELRGERKKESVVFSKREVRFLLISTSTPPLHSIAVLKLFPTYPDTQL